MKNTTNKKQARIILGVILGLFTVLIIVHATIKQNDRARQKAEAAKTEHLSTVDNPGGTGGDAGYSNVLFLRKRSVLKKSIGEKNTAEIEAALQERLLKDIGPRKKGYRAIIDDDFVRPDDPPQKWHYRVTITVENTHKYDIIIAADPDEEFTFKIVSLSKSN